MRYYSEDTVKGLLKQMDSHFVKYLENLPSIEIKKPVKECVNTAEALLDELEGYNKYIDPKVRDEFMDCLATLRIVVDIKQD